MAEAPAESYIRMTVRVEGDSLTIVDAHEIAGPLVQPDTVSHGVAHEILVNGRRVAIGSMPDADVSRSFSEIGAGPREHHLRRLDTYELPIRIPTSALRGTDPADVTINVVRVDEHPREDLNPVPLMEDPVVMTSLIATVNLGQTPLPTALQRIMTL